MLIFAPSTSQQRHTESIQNCIRDRIEAAFAGDIEYLFESAMAVRRLTQNSKSTSTSHRCAQRAADADDYHTTVARACTSQTVATIGPHNITHLHKLYTPPVPNRNHPAPTVPHQTYSLPGNICDTILTSKRNKGAGVNSDSIDLFITLGKKATPAQKNDIQFIFKKIYQNNIPPTITRYFTDVYLFCLNKDPTDPSKLRPLGIPTAIRRLIATHVARTFKKKFVYHLFPYNFAVGIEDGANFVVKAMQLAVEKYIDTPQQTNRLPTYQLAPRFSSTSLINSTQYRDRNSSTSSERTFPKYSHSPLSFMELK